MSILNQGHSNPLPSFNFTVFVDVLKFSFSKVSSIEIGMETQVLMEGGENRFAHSLSMPSSSEKLLVLERGVADKGIVTSLLNQLLRVGSIFGFIIIMVTTPGGFPKRIYVAQDVVLKKRSFTDLDASNSTVFVERMEWVYKSITELPYV